MTSFKLIVTGAPIAQLFVRYPSIESIKLFLRVSKSVGEWNNSFVFETKLLIELQEGATRIVLTSSIFNSLDLEQGSSVVAVGFLFVCFLLKN